MALVRNSSIHIERVDGGIESFFFFSPPLNSQFEQRLIYGLPYRGEVISRGSQTLEHRLEADWFHITEQAEDGSLFVTMHGCS